MTVKGIPAFKWGEDACDELRKIWGQMSASAIARVFSRQFNSALTRGAIIGKAHRMGLERLSPHKSYGGRPRSAQPKMTRQPRPKASPRTPAAPARVQPEAVVVALAPSPLMLSVMTINDSQCHYPFGDPKRGDFGYCGHRVRPGSSYCEHHHRIVWVPLSNRQRRTDGYHFSLPPDGLPAKRAPLVAA